jgi:hypothetical protein
MGLFKKVGKAISHGVKSVGNIAKKAFSGNVLNIATKALSVVPGLNAADLIGKGLSVLESGKSIQNWMKKGLEIFGKLTKGLGLTGKVANLIGGKTNPVGLISKLIPKQFQKVAGLLNNMMPGIGNFQNAFNLAKQFGLPNSPFQGVLAPPGFQEITKSLSQLQNVDPLFANRIGNPVAQFQAIQGLFQELQNLLGPGMKGKGLEQIIRA